MATEELTGELRDDDVIIGEGGHVPTLWPECTNCGTAYVLRRSMTFDVRGDDGLKYKWLWQRDCPGGDRKRTAACKKAPARMARIEPAA